MSETLASFSEVCGVQLVYSSDLVKGMQSAGLAGEFSATEALTRLLQGSGLTVRFSTPTTASLTRVSAEQTRVLGPVRVEGADQNSPVRGEGVAQLGGIRGGQDQEERGLRPVVAAVGAGAPTALEDIPRSVSVLTQTQIEAQDIQDFGEAIRRLPGLSMIERTASTGSNAATGEGSISARGFNITTVQIDGGAPRSLDIINNGLFSLDAYERVELVRGPNGIFAGTGSPGGSLNLVRKRPGATPSLGFSATVGSFDRLQAQVDWSTPSLAGTALASRTVASYEDQSFKWDNDHLQRASLYSMVDAPLGERARFEAGVTYQDVHEDGFYQGSYRYFDGPNLDVPFYFNYAPSWAYMDVRSIGAFSRFYARLLDDWNFDIGLTYGNSDKRSLDAVTNGSTNLLSNTKRVYSRCNAVTHVCTPRTGSLFARENYSNSENLGTDFRITGKASTWGIDHDISLTGSFNELVSVQTELARSNPAWSLIYTLDDFLELPDAPAPTTAEGNFTRVDDSYKSSSSAWGLSVTDVVSWRQRIFLTLSASLQDQENSAGRLGRRLSDGAPFSIGLDEMSSGDIDRAQSWMPSWTLAVKPLRAMSIYGTYVEGSDDQSTYFDPSGKQLAPTTYENAELGVKYGTSDWLLSVSGYKLNKTNVAVQIPDTRGLCGPTPSSYCYFPGGATVETTGYDVELSGRVFSSLELQVSYNSSDAKTLKTKLPVDPRLPPQQAKLFANWDVPWVPRLSVNVGAVYTGRIFEKGVRTIYDPDTFLIVDELPYQFAEAATTVVDVGADYAINDQLKLNLLVENVGGTEYYSTVSSFSQHVGNPRTVMLKALWREGGDRSGPTRSPTTGLAPFGDPSDWYGSIDFGQQDPSDWQAHSTGSSGQPVRWTFETEPSPAFNARLGYRLTPHWRTELDLGWRQTEFGKVGGNGSVPYGLCSLDYVSNFVGTAQDRLTHCYDPQGEGVHWSFLANVIHDFRAPEARLRPFLGVGLGATRSSIDFSGRFDGYTDTVFRDWYQATYGTPLSPPVAPGEELLGTDASWGLSFQGIAGLSWRVTDQATLDVTYKFSREALDVRTANLTDYYPRETLPDKTPEPNHLTGAGLPQLGSFKGDLDSHIFSVGLRWAFGASKAQMR